MSDSDMKINRFDDSDVKIAGDSFDPVTEVLAQDKTEEIICELDRQKSNGNLDRADKLGEGLGCMLAQVVNGAKTSAAVHECVLMAFSINVGLEESFVSQVVVTNAQQAFFETLEKEAPEFYNQLQNSGAFSLYYLKNRRKNPKQVHKEIGEAFAVINGVENDREMVDQGAFIYLNSLAEVERQKKELKFKEE